ncbi:trehalose-phosphatase [Kocuria carniphila]|uniref:trehalose-phosphatase n=1 Tax=Kocuria carniphila TaxID=262208 RepID=UPI0021A7640C|nr:trehalose-phosphatase [Kocuria carniphila]MCT1803656.1 trehalose-phosphatase [Kocuria carniphila]
MTETLSDALSRAAGADHLLIALDFDGTLAPFTEDPADSRPLPEAREALDALAGLPRTTVAIISGRPLEFLREVVDPARRMVLSGSHGAEMDLAALPDLPDDAEHDIHLTAEQLDLLDRAVDATEEMVSRYPGSRAELKPAGVCFHTRPIRDPRVSEQALEEMNRAYSELQGLRITPGQQVVECSVVSATKGDGLRIIQAAASPDVTVFAGDDVTDEDAMDLLTGEDLGIKVGEKESVATQRVSGPQELADVLSVFADQRARAVTSIK